MYLLEIFGKYCHINLGKVGIEKSLVIRATYGNTSTKREKCI